jgi:hypothetical protein
MSVKFHRPIIDRLLDRAWCEFNNRLEDRSLPPKAADGRTVAESVSGTLAWPLACAALASGAWQSKGFRRTRAVREVVETLGLTDGRYFARWIAGIAPEYLEDESIRHVNDWGNPVQAPGWSLGVQRAFSPTSLRYLAHALWLKREGLVKPNGLVVEIGVGFGGLAAMNALVSGASTVWIDLPEVERAASLMMRENGLGDFVAERTGMGRGFCLISNYAFTELSTALQDSYFDEIIRHSTSGIIVSNAEMFARGIGGRTNEHLVDSFRASGIAARIDAESPILGPSDRYLGNRVITWRDDSLS